MLVLGHVITFDRAVLPARGDDGDFALERHEGLENAGLAADFAPYRFGIAAVLDGGLALAVIAEAPRLQHRRPPDPLDRRLQRGGLADIGERRRADAEACNEFFLGQPVLCGRQDFRIGQNRDARGEKSRVSAGTFSNS